MLKMNRGQANRMSCSGNPESGDFWEIREDLHKAHNSLCCDLSVCIYLYTLQVWCRSKCSLEVLLPPVARQTKGKYSQAGHGEHQVGSYKWRLLLPYLCDGRLKLFHHVR